MLKKWGNFGKDWDLINIESVVNCLIRPNKVKELIQLISNNDDAQNVVKTIHFQNTFPFTYDVCKSTDISSNYSNLGHDVDKFKAGAIVAVEFQILLRNFKASKKIDAVKTYLFWLLEVYLVDNPLHLTISTPNKRQKGGDEWIVTLAQMKRTITSNNLLET